VSKVDLVLADAAVHLPGGEVTEGWLSVIDGVVDAVGSGSVPQAGAVVDCQGKWVLPGAVDIHVHFRDPGFVEKEDFSTGSAAAAAGGVTTVIDMPNTEGSVVTGEDLVRKLRVLDGRSHVDYGLYALLTDSAAHVDDLRALGVAGLKWMFGHEAPARPSARPVTRTSIRDALSKAAAAGLLVGVHAEDPVWHADLEGCLRAQGRTDVRAHGEARPPFIEALAIAQAAIVGQETGARLHIHHLSSAKGLEMVTAMRAALDVSLTVEVCPHHLFLTQDDLDRLGTRGKVNPPLRDQCDVDALWGGIAAGTIDCVASDHAPHTPAEKVTDSVWKTQSGLLGVETLFPLLFDEVRGGRLSTGQFTRLTAETPARLVGLDHRKGALSPGHDADIVVVDPDASTVVSAAALHSKHPDTPFEGRQWRGAIDAVYVRGRPVVQTGQVQSPPLGVYVPSQHRGDSEPRRRTA